MTGFLQVWDVRNPRIADYISVNIGYAVQPAQSSVTVGDVICFSSPIISSDGKCRVSLIQSYALIYSKRLYPQR